MLPDPCSPWTEILGIAFLGSVRIIEANCMVEDGHPTPLQSHGVKTCIITSLYPLDA